MVGRRIVHKLGVVCKWVGTPQKEMRDHGILTADYGTLTGGMVDMRTHGGLRVNSRLRLSGARNGRGAGPKREPVLITKNGRPVAELVPQYWRSWRSRIRSLGFTRASWRLWGILCLRRFLKTSGSRRSDCCRYPRSRLAC